MKERQFDCYLTHRRELLFFALLPFDRFAPRKMENTGFISVFPVIHSTLSAPHLIPLLKEKYGLSPATTCKLFRTGINHTYMVTDTDRKLVFRIYSFDWRSRLEIEEEIRLLNLLKGQGISVSYPISDLHAQYIQELPAPEGLRYGVLFSFAEGGKVRELSAITTHTIGVVMAQMHQITQCLTLQRVDYTPHILTQLPYQLASVHFSAALPEMGFVGRAGAFFAAEYAKIDPATVRRGAVHLDIWYDNMSIDGETEVTLFDFDFCGNGYLLFDLAYFLMQLYHTEPDKEKYQIKLEAFYTGYQSVAAISPEEKKWIPVAGLAIWLFYLGVQSQRFDNWSNIFLTENYLKRYLGMVKDWLGYHQIDIS